MEDSQKKVSSNFEKELKNISSLQDRISQTKKELNLLLKIENNETKNIQDIFKQSLLTTRNKLNFFRNHQMNEQHHEHLSKEIKEKQDRIRQMRTKEEKQLKYVKEMMKKSKEEERNLIRNNSLKHDEIIKHNKHINQQMKQKLVIQIKKEKQNFKQSLAQSRLNESKLKEVKLFNQTLAKLETRTTLQKELERLIKEKQMIESKVYKKKMLKLQMKQGVDQLKKLEKTQVARLINEQQDKKMAKRIKTLQNNPLETELINQLKLMKSIESLEKVFPLIPEVKLQLN